MALVLGATRTDTDRRCVGVIDSCDHEATSSARRLAEWENGIGVDDPAACAGPALGEGLLGGLDARVCHEPEERGV